MRRLTTVLVALLLFMGSLSGNQMTVRAEETEKEETGSAYELCYSAKSWEEFKALFENYKSKPGDSNGRVIKKVSENLEALSTFFSIGMCVLDEEAEEFGEAIKYVVSLYNQKDLLKFSVTIKDYTGPYSEILIQADKVKLTHLGNVVVCADIPYYENINAYQEQKKAYYYDKQILCYTCKVAYWNPDGTLEKTDSVPWEKLSTLKDAEKKQIDTNFEGTILILLCTTDEILGWANIEDLYQYEDAFGNMEFYNPAFIKYYENEEKADK